VRGFGLIAWWASTRPIYTEAYEGFGDGMLIMVLGDLGLFVSLVVGLLGGGFVAVRVGRRLEQ
jgi:hypothetical protein